MGTTILSFEDRVVIETLHHEKHSLQYIAWSPVNKIDNLNRDFFVLFCPMPRLNFEFEFDTHLQVALVI